MASSAMVEDNECILEQMLTVYESKMTNITGSNRST